MSFFIGRIDFSLEKYGIKHRLNSEEFSLLIGFLNKINFFDRINRKDLTDDMLDDIYIHRSPTGELSPKEFDFNKFYSINLS